MNYKEAIERIKARFNKWALDDEDLDAIKTLVPELEEDEDERIRKELIDFINHYRHNTDLTSEQAEWCKKVLGYLGKQKEQEAIEDVIKNITKDKEAATKFLKSAGIMDENGELAEMYRSEQKPEEKLSKEEYVKKFKALCDAYEIKLPNREYDIYGLCKDLHKLFGDIQKPTDWSEEDEKNFEEAISYIKDDSLKDFVKSLRHQSHKWYIKKGHWYMCIVDKPEYGWTKGKVYQSPEDNRIETNYKGSLTNWPDKEPWFRPATRSEIPDNQPHWKPSKEQMEALKRGAEYLAEYGTSDDDLVLNTLYDDLEKL